MKEAVEAPERVSFLEAFLYWLKLGFISFGGPTGRPDQHDASGAGGETQMDFRAPLPARAQLHHGAPGTGSTTTGNLYS